jgi:DNA-binding transcriptional LysR family regulator
VRTGSPPGQTAAARSLAYTQPAVSHHVTRLEAEVGTALLVRHGRGVRLTEAGRALVAHADAILARLADAEEEVAAIAGLRAGRVRVAAFPTAAAAFVPAALASLHARAPEVEVTLVEAEPPQALAARRAGEVDVGVVFTHAGEPPDGDSRLRTVPLRDDPSRWWYQHSTGWRRPGNRCGWPILPDGPRPPAVTAMLDELRAATA